MKKHFRYVKNKVISTKISCGLTTIEYLLLGGLTAVVCSAAIGGIGANAQQLFSTLNESVQTKTIQPQILEEKPTNSSLSGVSWAIKGVTEPVNCDTKLADTESLNVYEYYAADQPEGTLIFYPRNGVTGLLPNTNSAADIPWNANYYKNIYKMICVPGVQANEQAQCLFFALPNCTSIDVTNLDTSRTVNMANMFAAAQSITSLDLSNLNTNKVVNMENMFNRCQKLLTLNLSSFDTSNVISMGGMFWNCQKLLSINLSSFNTSNVTNMNQIFSACQELRSLNINNFDTSKVTRMYGMFKDCYLLSEINVSSFDTKQVTEMCQMFYNCKNLQFIDISNFTTSKITLMAGMFYYCEKITSISFPSDIVSSPAVKIGASTNTIDNKGISAMFTGDSKLKAAGQIPSWYVGKYATV